jgi:hypothetical protein
MGRRVFGLVALTALAVSAVCAAEDEKLLAGFEWEEFAAKVGRSMVIGEPIEGAPKPGFRAKRYTSLEQVAPAGFQIFHPKSSRDHAGLLMTRKNATQGQFAYHFQPATIEMGSWRNLERVERGQWRHGFTPHAPGYEPVDWYYQRFCHVWQVNWRRTTDWSAYDRLRFDVLSVGQPIRLGVRVRDGVGPWINAGPTGVKTALGVFTVPADETVTCEFPLAEMARVGEVDLAKVHRVFIRINGLPSKTAPDALYLDNIRLLRQGVKLASKLKVVAIAGEPRPHSHLVHARPPTVRDAEKRKRRLGPVEPLGPVTINQAALFVGAAGHLVGPGHFGGSGVTYFRNARRGVVAYDNDRLLVVMTGKASLKGGARGGLIAFASFDGGRTWGGLTPQDKGFTVLKWYLRAGVSADSYGDLYYLGTPNCDSYREGQDSCVHRLAFTGETWVDDRFAVVYQNGYKCPGFGRGLRLASGRIWMLWHDGFGGSFAKCSDDDGFTFRPCKDASLEPPRPFYEPKLGAADGPPTPPKRVILWPAQRVEGFLLVPYRGQVAAVGAKGYQVHDGTKWGPKRPGPKWPKTPKADGIVSETVLDEKQIFLARSARYRIRGPETPAALQVARQAPGGWTVDVLEGEAVDGSILTASGQAVYCFYVKKAGEGKYEVRYRCFAAGKWGESVLLATEPFRINHVAAPQICPPSYACVLYDQHAAGRKDKSVVRFIRVPNR